MKANLSIIPPDTIRVYDKAAPWARVIENLSPKSVVAPDILLRATVERLDVGLRAQLQRRSKDRSRNQTQALPIHSPERVHPMAIGAPSRRPRRWRIRWLPPSPGPNSRESLTCEHMVRLDAVASWSSSSHSLLQRKLVVDERKVASSERLPNSRELNNGSAIKNSASRPSCEPNASRSTRTPSR